MEETSDIEPKSQKDVWVITYHGIKRGVLVRSYGNWQKILVELPEPALLDPPDVFFVESSAYAEAASRQQKIAMEALQRASEYNKLALGKS
jgi:hypothetical protein